MKTALFLILCTLSTYSLAVETWLKKPEIYTYQDNNIISKNMGSDEDTLGAIVAKINALVIEKTEHMTPLKNEAIVMVFVFNEKNKKVWVVNENQETKAKLQKIANEVLKKVALKTNTGPVAFSLRFSPKDNTLTMPTKPPIPTEWDSIVNENKSISASKLFEQLLTDNK